MEEKTQSSDESVSELRPVLTHTPADSEMGSDELKATAYHEAGHAVMALELGRPIHKVTIVPGQSDIGLKRDGVCHIKKGRSKASKDWLEDEVLILFAGLVAEARWTGTYNFPGATQDLRQIRRYSLMRADGEKQIERLERRWFQKTEHYLSDPVLWSATETIAESLLQSQTISGRAARHLMEQAKRQSSR
jgi:hypothetical protein